MSPYVVLGITADADGRAIRNAFRSLARRYHPDAGEGSSPEQFRRVVEAYEILSDPVRRQACDRALRAAAARPSIPVEPISPQVEPLTQPRWRPAVDYSTSPLAWTAPAPDLDDLFEELWRALEDDFFSADLRARW